MSDVITFQSPEVAQSLRVNAERRTISGIALPWGQVADNGFAKWRFAKDSLRWANASWIKLNLDHNRSQPIGVIHRIESTPVGLDVSFKIARGEDGDRALAMAEDGVRDGFSVEVDFKDGDEWIPDPGEKSVRLVRRATLTGAALTAFPAFDAARVESVVAHRQAPEVLIRKDPPAMSDNENPQEDRPANEFERARAIEFSREVLGGNLQVVMSPVIKEMNDGLAKAMEDNRNAMSSAFTAALEKMEVTPHQRGTVRAARFALEQEAPVYSFNGRGNSLVKDAWYASPSGGKDPDALARLARYRTQVDNIALMAQSQWFATVTTGSNGEIIPPGYRPDLYVGELLKGRPIVNQLSRGQIENASPFTVPVFVSATSVTAAHSEGTNPTDGTLVFTTKTVSPAAISGLVKMTREMVDSSNPAIDQIALATMRESYARQTEAAVYTKLNGANGVGGSITSTLVPSGAQADVSSGDGNDLLLKIRDRLSVYPFRRFGAPTGAVMSQEATTALAIAQSAEDGRFQLPSVGAVNSAGVGNAVSQGWFIDGMAFVPAWSMTGNTSGDADVIIINSADAWAWESPTLMFRYEERSGPAEIELALFGYFGTHVLRPVGLSGIRHTAS